MKQPYPSLGGKGGSRSLLLYGCQVAMGDAGAEFIEKLHRLTGANIAASSTLVGSKVLGANWELDVERGMTTSPLAFTSEAINNYAHTLGYRASGTWRK
jgi:hypothetical protein